MWFYYTSHCQTPAFAFTLSTQLALGITRICTFKVRKWFPHSTHICTLKVQILVLRITPVLYRECDSAALFSAAVTLRMWNQRIPPFGAANNHSPHLSKVQLMVSWASDGLFSATVTLRMRNQRIPPGRHHKQPFPALVKSATHGVVGFTRSDVSRRRPCRQFSRILPVPTLN